MKRVIAGFLLALSLSACSPEESQGSATSKVAATNAPAASLAAPDIFAVTKDDYMAAMKRTVEVSLSREATEQELSAIAENIFKARSKDTERTFIGYRIDGSAGSYWATTHYNPDLKVEILE